MNGLDQATEARHSIAVRGDRVETHPPRSRHDLPCQVEDGDLWAVDGP